MGRHSSAAKRFPGMRVSPALAAFIALGASTSLSACVAAPAPGYAYGPYPSAYYAPPSYWYPSPFYGSTGLFFGGRFGGHHFDGHHHQGFHDGHFHGQRHRAPQHERHHRDPGQNAGQRR